jgi:hypothetical protein
MKNLNKYPDPRFPVHQLAVSRKMDPALRNRLLAIEPAIRARYATYDSNVTTSTLEVILPDTTFENHRIDLEQLYWFKSLTIREIKKRIEDQQPDTIKYTCQSCGIGAVSSMDHYLPMASYPEFVVNPYNLIPSCSGCNGTKNDVWLNNGARVFLNPFLDQLPQAEFLFVDVFLDSQGEMDFEFRLRNTNNIPAIQFAFIETHFKKLGLLERMKKASIGHLTEFKNQLKNSLKELTLGKVKDIQLANDSDDRAAYGANYWKAALHKSLINSTIFLDTVT